MKRSMKLRSKIFIGKRKKCGSRNNKRENNKLSRDIKKNKKRMSATERMKAVK